MIRHKSAMKQLRSSKHRKARNSQVKSNLKTLVRDVRITLANNDLERGAQNLSRAISAIQRAGNRNIIHKNTASRKISRLVNQYQKVKVSVQARG